MNTNLIDNVVKEVVEEILKKKDQNGLNCVDQNVLKPGSFSGDYDKLLASKMEHSMIRPDATLDMVKKFCEEAIKYGFRNVSLSPCFVNMASQLLKGTDVKVSTAVAFPLGAATTKTKVYEALEAVENGASEIDLPVNIGLVKCGEYKSVKHDIEFVVEAVKGKALIKVVVDLGQLTDEEKVRVGVIAKMAGAQFLKVAAVSKPGGVTAEDIKFMKQVTGSEVGIKADGGIKDYHSAMKIINAGADTIGASGSVKIVTEK